MAINQFLSIHKEQCDWIQKRRQKVFNRGALRFFRRGRVDILKFDINSTDL